MSAIIIDTNGLCAQAQYHIDILGQLKELGFSRFYVTDCILEELKRLKTSSKPKERVAAEVGTSLLSSCDVIRDSPDAIDCDDSIVLKAKELNVAVFSLDRLLRRKLATQGMQVVYLRGGKKLEKNA